MEDAPPIRDDEYVIKHIPGGPMWQGKPTSPRVTSGNFELRKDMGETGSSCSREEMTSPQEMLARLKTNESSRVARAQVQDIRHLGFEVVPKQTCDDPGHAEIISKESSLDNHSHRQKLAALFHFID